MRYAGAAFLFKKNNTGIWTEYKKITPLDRDSLDYFGTNSGSLFIDGSNIFIAAVGEDHDENGANPIQEAWSIYHFSNCQTVHDSVSINSCGNYISGSNKVYTLSGVYNDTISTVRFCDSIITTNLTIRNNSVAAIYDTVCYSYISPLGRILDSSGIYYDVISNQSGCDSTITIHLKVNNTTAQQVLSLCNSVTSPRGRLLNTTGLYNDTLFNSN